MGHDPNLNPMFLEKMESLTGTGYFDMVAYGQFNDGKMTDYIPSDEDIKRSTDQLPKV